MLTLKGNVYTKDCVFEPGIISIEDDMIVDVKLCDKQDLSGAEAEKYYIPGLVDVHFHGAAGYDFSDGTKEAYRAIEAYENAHGITTICPATMTLPEDELCNIVQTAADCKLASLRGIHLEGPFISKEKKGAQKEDYIIAADAALIEKLDKLSGGLVKLVSIAPETEGAIDCIKRLNSRYHFSIAHTTADYEVACKAIEAGADHVTHLYNAMPVSTHRAPSVLGAAADHDSVYVELICDGIHVHPSVVRNTFRIFTDDRVVLISDSMRATGMPDGEYTLGGQDVTVKGGRATLRDGTIAGSATNLYDCMMNAVSMGIPLEAAIKAATINPAKSIGIDNIVGSIEPGKRADILCMGDCPRVVK